MILISHRGNMDGPYPEKENSVEYIESSISSGFDCEIDIWSVDGLLFLGHDRPTFRIESSFLLGLKNNLWVHAKNEDVIPLLRDMDLNYFWHQSDKFTITSKGFVWCFPSQKIFNFGVNLMPELNSLNKDSLSDSVGVCSDYISRFK